MANKKPSLNLILLGDPGAGKATQARLLSEQFDFIDFDMGKELTRHRKTHPKVDAIHKTTTDKGKLTPTKIVREIIEKKLSSNSASKAILFDGTPKMLGEAKLVRSLIKKLDRPEPLVIYLSIPQKEILARVLNRKGYYEKKFSQRADDNVRALKNRAQYYKKNITEVVDYFSNHYTFKKLNGLGTIQEVHERILNAINKYR